MKYTHMTIKAIDTCCREKEDYYKCINCIAISANKSATKILAYTILSNHIHLIIHSQNTPLFTHSFKDSYTKFYNNKYKKKGKIFKKANIETEINTKNEFIIKTNYVLKNPVHHFITRSAFDYPFTSINIYYSDNTAYKTEIKRCPHKLEKQYISAHNLPLTQELFMDINGHIKPESFLHYKELESIYETHRSFIYNMTKLTKDEEDLIYLEGSKRNIKEIIQTMDFKVFKLSDIDLCDKIDRIVKHELKIKHFQYTIPNTYRLKLAHKLTKSKQTSIEQASRCLALSKNEIIQYKNNHNN